MLNPYHQYSGVLETCLALEYWFFEALGSESVNICFRCSKEGSRVTIYEMVILSTVPKTNVLVEK